MYQQKKTADSTKTPLFQMELAKCKLQCLWFQATAHWTKHNSINTAIPIGKGGRSPCVYGFSDAASLAYANELYL